MEEEVEAPEAKVEVKAEAEEGVEAGICAI